MKKLQIRLKTQPVPNKRFVFHVFNAIDNGDFGYIYKNKCQWKWTPISFPPDHEKFGEFIEIVDLHSLQLNGDDVSVFLPQIQDRCSWMTKL